MLSLVQVIMDWDTSRLAMELGFDCSDAGFRDEGGLQVSRAVLMRLSAIAIAIAIAIACPSNCTCSYYFSPITQTRLFTSAQHFDVDRVMLRVSNFSERQSRGR
jgi:hypothetical protein